MFRLRQIAGVLAPCCLLAGCTSTPDLPDFTALHPAHPDARVAVVHERSSALDPITMEEVPQPDAMEMGEMDHSQHGMSMNMSDGQEEPTLEAEEGDGPSHPGGQDDS